MGYLHINNLYKNKDILLFKECYAMEKIHGTSAHISISKEKGVNFFAGGTKHETFTKLFDANNLLGKYNEIFVDDIVLFGESYGGKCQGMSETYGKEPKFVVFDVKIGETWLRVPDAEDVAKKFGLEFVDYVKTNTDLDNLNFERDKPSVQAIRNGCENDKKREGVVLRPLIELRDSRGNRIISKHKGDHMRETKTPRIVSDEELNMLEDAKAIANEWVTAERLNHVLDKILGEKDITMTGKVIKAMIDDVLRESEDEIIVSKQATIAIGKKTATMFKKLVCNL